MAPIPKPPHMLQRRNRVATRATLPTEEQAATRKVPELPPLESATEKWHPLVLRWWKAVWKSPMAEEFLGSDTDDLFLLAHLRQDFYKATDPMERQKLAAELRQGGVRFGLSPIDRRRLQWEVEKAEQATEKTHRRRQIKQAQASDPRKTMAVVK